MNINISFGQNTKDWVDYFSAIAPFLIGIFTLGFYFWNSYCQKQQWLNDALIKNELNVLLHMKNLLSKNLVALNWYFRYVLAECVYEDILKPSEFIKQMHMHHPHILELYNFYRENYYVFEKYNLLKELKIIHFMMHMSKIIDEQEYRYVVVEQFENGDIKFPRYQFMKDIQIDLEDWIPENRPDLLKAKENCTKKCKDFCKNCSNVNVALDTMHNEIYWLIHKFDKATLAGSKEEFDIEKEKEKIWTFEPYTNLKNKVYKSKRNIKNNKK